MGVIGKGWVAAGDMEVGDKVYLYSGEGREIKELKFEHLDSPIKVYNFEVEDWHTYFVSEQDVFVHNSCGKNSSSRGSTGRTEPNSLKEQLAMSEVASNPLQGSNELKSITMTEPRWPSDEGWVKMSKNVNEVEIHFVYNKLTGIFDDFKFK